MPKTIILWLNKKVYDRAGNFTDTRSCPIATAMKDYGYTGVNVGGFDVDLDTFDGGRCRYDIVDQKRVNDKVMDRKAVRITLTKTPLLGVWG